MAIAESLVEIEMGAKTHSALRILLILRKRPAPQSIHQLHGEMVNYRFSVIFAFVFASVGVNAGDDLGDFSNDLFTDLGPLLALFGDTMTKQYLSESTSFLDYLIFAMAPIGIITAIVSVIRVCGHSSLRAFVGRSQEGEGMIEAELCTSTSRDVCELFNRGGIARVLGRPSILELVYVPPRQDGSGSQSGSSGETNAGLFLSRNYFDKHYQNSGVSYWEEVKGRSVESWSSESTSARSFAPSPNLSLNVGIVKRPLWVFCVIASTGVLLQTGVIALAGAGVWKLGWNLIKGGNPSSRDYAPAMFITGTTLMCGGMWLCAYLIGQTTQESRFRRSRSCQDQAQQPRLLWLQPGPQVIGDQNFDSFAHLEDTDDPLQVWMSSKKSLNHKFERYTVFAVLAVLIGYIMQFIALRGMKAWVSIAQLIITLIMSVLRGSLRMQRLGRNDNEFGDMPELIIGHELDWLALRIAGEKANWHVTGRRTPEGDEPKREPSSNGGTQSGPSGSSPPKTTPKVNAKPAGAEVSKANKGRLSCEDLLRIRVRLAHLTGHLSLGDMADSEYQHWKDDFVKVRAKTGKLATAICQTAASLFPGSRQKDIELKIQASSLNQSSLPEQQVSITLRSPRVSSQTSWRIDSAKIEAMLGLWMWSLVSDERLHMCEDVSSRTIMLAEKVMRARLVSAGLASDQMWDKAARLVQGEMDLWLAPTAVKFSEGTFVLFKQELGGLGLLFQNDSVAEQDWEGCRTVSSKTMRPDIPLRRACGLDLLQKFLNSESNDTAVSLHAQLLQIPSTSSSLLDLCAQELFTGLILSLASHLTPDMVDKTTVVENSGTIKFQNKTVSVIADAFVRNGLGTSSDGLLCIVPALHEQQQLPSVDVQDLLSAVTKTATAYRQSSEWDRAEILLQWACERFVPSNDSSEQAFVQILRATGELYRKALAEHSNEVIRTMGRTGIKWMVDTFRDAGANNAEVKEILDSYQEIANRTFPQPSKMQSDSNTDKVPKRLVQAIMDRERTEALYQLCLTKPGALGTPAAQAALPLAVRNDWDEVFDTLLEMKANPNSRDQDARTAVSYCAELGYESYLKILINLGASLDLSEANAWTPLFWAAKNGRLTIAEHLFNSGQVDVNRVDDEKRSPLWVAADQRKSSFVQSLLKAGATIARRHTGLKEPLVVACQKGHIDIVQQLLENGAELKYDNFDTTQGPTPLHAAVEGGHGHIVRELLENGADSNLEYQGHTPLYRAVEKGDKTVTQQLLEMGAPVLTNHWSTTCVDAMDLAIQQGHDSIVRQLLDRGFDINCSLPRGNTALERAIWCRKPRIVQLLLDKGAKIDLKNESGETPLLVAAQLCHGAIVRKLLKAGAECDCKDRLGNTPLMHAALMIGFGEKQDGLEEVINQLMEAGANPYLKNRDGASPMAIAVDSGYENFVELLRVVEKSDPMVNKGR